MTQEQIEAFVEVKRLLSDPRRSAILAYPDNHVRLCSKVQVASLGGPGSF